MQEETSSSVEDDLQALEPVCRLLGEAAKNGVSQMLCALQIQGMLTPQPTAERGDGEAEGKQAADASADALRASLELRLNDSTQIVASQVQAAFKQAVKSVVMPEIHRFIGELGGADTSVFVFNSNAVSEAVALSLTKAEGGTMADAAAMVGKQDRADIGTGMVAASAAAALGLANAEQLQLGALMGGPGSSSSSHSQSSSRSNTPQNLVAVPGGAAFQHMLLQQHQLESLRAQQQAGVAGGGAAQQGGSAPVSTDLGPSASVLLQQELQRQRQQAQLKQQVEQQQARLRQQQQVEQEVRGPGTGSSYDSGDIPLLGSDSLTPLPPYMDLATHAGLQQQLAPPPPPLLNQGSQPRPPPATIQLQQQQLQNARLLLSQQQQQQQQQQMSQQQMSQQQLLNQMKMMQIEQRAAQQLQFKRTGGALQPPQQQQQQQQYVGRGPSAQELYPRSALPQDPYGGRMPTGQQHTLQMPMSADLMFLQTGGTSGPDSVEQIAQYHSADHAQFVAAAAAAGTFAGEHASGDLMQYLGGWDVGSPRGNSGTFNTSSSSQRSGGASITGDLLLDAYLRSTPPPSSGTYSTGSVGSLNSGGLNPTAAALGGLPQMANMMMMGNDSGSFAAGAAAAGGAGMPDLAGVLPPHFTVLPPAVLWHILHLVQSSPVIRLQDFDEKVVNKMALLVDKYGQPEALSLLDNLASRMRTKQSVMKNGPGYLDVAVSSHLDMLKAHGTGPSSSIASIQEYARQALSHTAFAELCNAIQSSQSLLWEHLDQGIIHLLKRLPQDAVGQTLQEISCRSLRNVDNVKGFIVSIINSKLREQQQQQQP